MVGSESKKQRGTWQHFMAGGCAGVAQIMVGHPFDTIKVRMQTQGPQYSGMIDCIAQTFRKEGLGGFYRGLSPPLTLNVVTSSFVFGTFTKIKHAIHDSYQARGVRESPVVPAVLAGSLTGMIFTVVFAPVELVKARLQVQRSGLDANKGPIHCVRTLVNAHGIKGLYVGVWPTFICRSFMGVYFGMYELLTQLSLPYAKSKNTAAVATLVSGALAGATSWTIHYPLDVVKNRIQTQPSFETRTYSGVIDCFKKTYQREGLKAFFRGWTPAVLRSLPTNAIRFFVFESMLSLLNTHR